jgi:CBS domain containing-hemolysin-like protein
LNEYTLIISYALLAITASFICSILEAVLLSTTHGHIVALRDTHPKISLKWADFKEDPERPLTAILTLNTIAHTVGALGVGAEVKNLSGSPSVAVVSALLTLAILLFSEILPKTIGALYWRKLTIISANLLLFLIFILFPIVWPIEKIRTLLPAAPNEAVTRDELSHLADIAEEEDVIEEDEETVIKNLLKLREMEVGSIMTPRVVMTTVSSKETIESVMQRLPIMIHGRMPVLKKQNIDEVQGLVLRNDILKMAAEDNFDCSMESLLRPIEQCTMTSSVDKALDIFLENKAQMLVVRDSFGGTVGLLTMEDVIETLLGVEIVDESDQEAIKEGTHHEDMRELAKIRFDNNDEDEN